jgi:hypothetical protein
MVRPEDLYIQYDYSIPYTEAELKYISAEKTGNLEDTEFDFGFDTVAIRQTDNPFLRWWGGFCADLCLWALRQSDKYGDYYMVLDEEYENRKGEVADLVEIVPSSEL